MSLIVQPDDGIGPVVSAIHKAKTSIDIGIFRLDRGDIARALRSAVARGVPVRTLIAHTNRGGDKRLRKLEPLKQRRDLFLIEGDPQAKLAVVSWGSVAGVAREAQP